MRFEAFMMANGAGTENGLLNAQGGGWEHYSPSFFPWTIRGAICGTVVLDDAELGSTPIVRFGATAQDGQELHWQASMTVDGVRPPAKPGVPMRIPFVTAIAFVVAAPTLVTVIATSVDGVVLASTTFSVNDPTPDQLPD